MKEQPPAKPAEGQRYRPEPAEGGEGTGEGNGAEETSNGNTMASGKKRIQETERESAKNRKTQRVRKNL